jgi:CsoR family transcriptional regulator, copper-sensing transcriptional repressor
MATLTPRPRGNSTLEHAGQIRARLRRIEGQVKGIERMYDDGRPCPEILDQVAAVRGALDDLGLLILSDHVRGCLEPTVYDSDGKAGAARLLLAIRRFVRSG